METHQNRLTLAFRNKELEHAYRADQEEFLRTAVRSGMISSLILWSVGVVALYFIVPDKFQMLAATIIGSTFPYFLFLIYATYLERFQGWFHLLAASSNLLAGLLLLVIFFHLQVSEYAILTALIFLVFFGLYSYRFRWRSGLALASLYMACFQFYISFVSGATGGDYILMTFYAWSTVGLSLVAGRMVEANDRLAFVNRITIEEQKKQVQQAKEQADSLLLNILPKKVAEELKTKGSAEAVHYDQVTVLFTDFKGFTAMSEKITPKELVKDLHECFSAFDRICEKYGVEKIKTIGDAYMAAGGVPGQNKTHAADVVKAAFEFRDFVEEGKARKIKAGLPFFEIRIGIHTGPVVAGIVGVKKFQYDIWGDTVNTASRMESSGEVGKVNISESTYALLKDDASFSFENRGKIQAKGKGEMEMYFVQEG